MASASRSRTQPTTHISAPARRKPAQRVPVVDEKNALALHVVNVPTTSSPAPDSTSPKGTGTTLIRRLTSRLRLQPSPTSSPSSSESPTPSKPATKPASGRFHPPTAQVNTHPNAFTSPGAREAALRARGLLPASPTPPRKDLSEQERLRDARVSVLVPLPLCRDGDEEGEESAAARIKREWEERVRGAGREEGGERESEVTPTLMPAPPPPLPAKDRDTPTPVKDRDTLTPLPSPPSSKKPARLSAPVSVPALSTSSTTSSNTNNSPPTSASHDHGFNKRARKAEGERELSPPFIVESPADDVAPQEIAPPIPEPHEKEKEQGKATDARATLGISDPKKLPRRSATSPRPAPTLDTPSPPVSARERRTSLGLFKKKSRDHDLTSASTPPPPSAFPPRRASFINLRRSLGGGGAKPRPKSLVVPSASAGAGTGAGFDASHLPPSPSLPSTTTSSSLAAGVPPSPSYTGSFSSKSQAFSSKSRQSVGVGRRVPLSPTMHSRGSILLETKEIQDEESRRLSEMAFLL
ncbi:hypothetical protein PLICRDRAFT_45220 [Plicaturopsis crispa FD-325 SS-3]|uniref:Unplaced genomic scaffold PLICRscaffold_15, whole genome shotgun sequence n=1 Tax=Plicaturopsis crispa FD-325 SS-3 TaxID=944288 RepID=A0A0C9T710_PLICR|nr:hypothetical protein PLICRDRAFT_45220 [Plicaturopsis crispa FD-325 SS-3]